MAGATLLAFSNGATDLITVLVASSAEGGESLAVGSLFGASTFAITVILSGCILIKSNNKIEDLSQGNFYRDIGFYILGVAAFIVLGFVQVSYGIAGIILLLIYVTYVSIVYYQEVQHNKKKTERRKLPDGVIPGITVITPGGQEMEPAHFVIDVDGESEIEERPSSNFLTPALNQKSFAQTENKGFMVMRALGLNKTSFMQNESVFWN